MSQVPVKYVKKGTLHEKPIPAFEANYIPVVPLSALREVVEGLRLKADEQTEESEYHDVAREGYNLALDDLLDSLEM